MPVNLWSGRFCDSLTPWIADRRRLRTEWTPLAHSGEPPEPDRTSLPLRVWRIVVIGLLIFALLLVLAYCLVQLNDDEPTATPTAGPTLAASSPTPTSPTPTSSGTGARTAAPTTPGSTRPGSTRPGTTRPGTTAPGTGGSVATGPGPGASGALTTAPGVTVPTTTPAPTTTRRRPSATHTAAPPRAAPNTGGGGATGAFDVGLVATGSLLLLAAGALALFTARRWRRTW